MTCIGYIGNKNGKTERRKDEKTEKRKNLKTEKLKNGRTEQIVKHAHVFTIFTIITAKHRKNVLHYLRFYDFMPSQIAKTGELS